MTRHRLSLALVSLVAGAAAMSIVVGSASVTPAQAATCSDYAHRAAARRARDTRDGDGDGIYCDSLPCPCACAGGAATGRTHAPATPAPSAAACARPGRTVNVSFGGTRYPHIRAHVLRALRRGWPRTLVLNRLGADARRERLLAHIPTKPGMDRDEYPPAVGRGRGAGLVRGSRPRGWRADVAYVPSSENRSDGSTMAIKPRRLCDGTRFRYVS